VRQRSRQIANLLIAIAAVAAVAIGFYKLRSAETGLLITPMLVDGTPVTVFEPEAHSGKLPVIVVAHGFAGSQQLMRPIAVTLARNNYIAVTFDFPGHGRNPEPLGGGLADQARSEHVLLDALGQVVRFAHGLKQGNGQFALLGHSMASDIVVRYAEAHPDIAATIAVSLFAPEITATSPRDLLVIDGAWEPSVMQDEAFRVVGMAADGHAVADHTYGDLASGTGRRLVLARGAEHIGVIYSADLLTQSVAWLDDVFGRRSGGFIDRCGVWLGLMFLGLVALARPIARLLPVVSFTAVGSNARWGRLLTVTLSAAVLTPLILWKIPTNFLPILLGDYLAVHFALFGLLTAIGLRLTSARNRWRGIGVDKTALAIGALTVAAYSIIVLGVPLDHFVTSFMPIPSRLPLIAAMLVGTLPYFITDEWLTSGDSAPFLAYTVTKISFLLSLMLAVALNLERLFFLVIIIPVMLIFFIIFGLFSRWAYRRTGNPFVAAIGNALAMGWAVAVTFPVVAQ